MLDVGGDRVQRCLRVECEPGCGAKITNAGQRANGIVKDLNVDGSLRDPRNRWGGIMREIYSSDFEQANVEFIEFWLMDPFAEMPDHSGGELYFNLGS